MITEKRPREYAIEVLEIEDKQGRSDFLTSSVPDHYKEWVRRYVQLWWPKRHTILAGVKREQEARSVRKNKRRRPKRSKVITRYL